ncbi:MAG: helix-turn-helix domain-containing protein [Chloroflexota bacterium]|nr:helix-turn-helix domain-containing protein [Chloroflexota bacterium]
MSSPRVNAAAPVEIVPSSPLMPDDFVLRLTALKELAGLTWERMASLLGVDCRQLWRWRQGGVPGGGAMLSLVRLALQVPGGLAALTGQDVLVVRIVNYGSMPADAPTGDGREGIGGGRED